MDDYEPEAPLSEGVADLERPTEKFRLRAENERLRAALEPFAQFARQWDRKPLRGTADDIYGIHAGTEFEARLTLTDCRKARAALEGNGNG